MLEKNGTQSRTPCGQHLLIQEKSAYAYHLHTLQRLAGHFACDASRRIEWMHLYH